MKWIVIFLTIPSLLCAVEEDGISYSQLATARVLDQKENDFQTSTPYKISPNVNPVTGDLIEEVADFVIAGSEPLSVRRFYNHTGIYEPRYGGWRYNPESFLAANFEWIGQKRFAALGEFDGSIGGFKFSDQAYTYLFDAPEGYTAFHPSGQTHPSNTKINYWKIGDPKDKNRFQWVGEVIDGSGCKRSFTSKMHQWLTIKVIKMRHGRRDQLEITQITPNVWTPYQLPIIEERKPNGNIICYTPTQWKNEDLYPRPPLLEKITAYNSDKTKILGWIEFHYNKDKQDDVRAIMTLGSDGRYACMYHQGSSPILLNTVCSPDKPQISYGYQGQWINRVERPEGRVITTEYNAEGKVAAQYAPVGPNGEMEAIGRYIYSPNMTQVIDAEGHKVEYHFDDNKRLHTIKTLQNDQVYRIDRFNWDSETGNCLRKTVADANDTPLLTTEYKYDANHNPIEEKVGNGHEWRILTRTFSEDGFNLKLSESDREGKTIRYHYKAGTNLLTSELIYAGKKIVKRTFHTYDDCAIRIKTIIDDGSNPDTESLKGVTYRKITEIQPKQTLPCFGLPEVVLEKTIDRAGHEILLKKVIYTYTPFGKVQKEDHFDANDVHRYTIGNIYDEKERLISKTDPLGNCTQFTYDDNHNLISITEPNPGQYKEITYDRANRPTQIADWQTDGSILFVEKRYDRLGQVIAEIDACGNETRFDYDMLGRVIATHYPDGTTEKKEYDLFGNVTKTIDGKGYETRTEHHFLGKPTAIYYPDGSEEHFTYNLTGTLSTHIDKNGAKSVYQYDIFDQPIRTEVYSSTEKLLKDNTVTYTPFCKLFETDSEGSVTTYSYDFSGRKIAEQIGKKKISYSYDALGRLSFTDSQYFQTIEEYDNADQLISKTIKDLKGKIQLQEAYAYDALGNSTHFITSHGAYETCYNSFGKPILEKNPLGFATRYEYQFGQEHSETAIDANGIKSICLYDSRGREAEFYKKNRHEETISKSSNSYDKNGNLIRQSHWIFYETTPINTISHLWEYGPMGRLERFIEAGEKETQYLYDSKGRLTTVTKSSGIQLNYEWDDLGRLSRYFSIDFDYEYTYDRHDRLISIYDRISCQKTQRSYNALGEMTQEILGNGLKLKNTYDDQGRRISLVLPDNSTIDYRYQGAYLYQVCRKDSTYTYRTRDLEGSPIEIELPKELGQISIERDALSRWKAFNSPYYNSQFPEEAYDPIGNLLQYSYRDSSEEVDCLYQYDDHHQLISENEHTYRFDSLQNRLKKDDQPHQINNLCQVTHDGHATYEYDLDGNLIFDGEWHYRYDTQDRLIALEMKNKRIEYEYDPFHRRLSRRVFTKGRQTECELYIWDGDNEIGGTSVKGKITQLRVLGEGLGAEIGAATLYELDGKTYLPIHDHRGCVVTLIDSRSKKTKESYRYTAFGEELTNNRLSPWRFSSKRVEEETGLLFFGRRYYFPSLGRWITQDPEGFEDGPNLYAYLKNCPLADFDPYGLWSWSGMWGGTKEAFWGAGSYLWEGARGAGYCVGKMGAWMYADFQYEYFNDRSFFEQKSYQAVEGWKNLGRAAWDDPLGMIVPGFMEAWRNPTSPAAWGKAAVDIGLIGFSAAKIGNAARLGRVGCIGEELATFGKAEILSTDRMMAQPLNSVASFTEHGMKRAVQRGVTDTAIFDALSNPLKIREIKIDHLGRPSQRFIGKNAEVVINPSTKQIISVNSTSTKKANRLIKDRNTQ